MIVNTGRITLIYFSCPCVISPDKFMAVQLAYTFFYFPSYKYEITHVTFSYAGIPADVLSNHLRIKFQGVVNIVTEVQQIC